MRKDVRILLVGEPGVGKTSLILSLVSEEFPEEVPAKAEEITIPADVTPEKVPTHIVDFSERDQTDDDLSQEILKAHVICVVYAVDEPSTVDKITLRWMPLLRKVLEDQGPKPVVFVGNKSDLIEVSSMEAILPIMNDFAEVETCVECSAKTLKNISEVFYYAQKAVLHPTAPLYIPIDKDLTPYCKKALTRIFKIVDQDNDGVLNNNEVYNFQRRCFGVPLQPQALDDVKSVIRKHISDGISRDGITLKGFLFLHMLFIQRGRHETTWTVLRKFGYNDEVQLDNEYLFPHIKVPKGSTAELSSQGLLFVNNLFDKYDEDGDGALSPTEVQKLFDTCPTIPWTGDMCAKASTSTVGWLNRKGYLGLWMMNAYLDIQSTLETLAYLGYMYEHDNPLSAVLITRDKRIDLQKRQTNRSVFQCYVIGPKGVGKTTFLQGLLGRNLQYIATIGKEKLPNVTINTVLLFGQEKYLILSEMDVGRGLSELMTAPELTCDVACLLYDVTNPKSFEVCTKIYKQFFVGRGVPILVIGCKGEYRPVVQDHPIQPSDFCHKNKLPPPQLFSSTTVDRELFLKVASMAVYPMLVGLVDLLHYDVSLGQRLTNAWSMIKCRHLRTLYQTEGRSWFKWGLGFAILSAVGLAAYKYISPKFVTDQNRALLFGNS